MIMDEAHKSKYYVHPGADKMYYDLRDRYWWPGIKKDIAQPEIPEWKWEGIAMDFVTKLRRISSEHDTIWVIVDWLTKSAHFLPMHEDYKMDRLARLYLNEIVARNGVPISSYLIMIVDLCQGFGSQCPVAYRHTQPEELNGVHDTFHVSNLKKCLADPTLQREFKKLKRSRIPIIKVRWNSKRGPEFKCEREDQMRLKYLDLFSSVSG
nr:putative reverse transcriptase domain-containing protein [Tanacetum cinerariifolium]